MRDRVLAVGNRFVYPDNAALSVFDAAQKIEHWCVEWIDGGLGGLSLLPYFEEVERVLIIDYMPQHEHLELVTPREVFKLIGVDGYSHQNAFLYLLRALPTLLTKVPEIFLLACNPKKEDFIETTISFVAQWSRCDATNK